MNLDYCNTIITQLNFSCEALEIHVIHLITLLEVDQILPYYLLNVPYNS